jgi:ribosomal protein S18 acetylase RimI-like enzyme
VGRALLDDAEGQAREHGSRTLALDTWVDNRPARALYMKAGFVETGRTPAASGLPGGVSLLKQLS